jgi:hypothetical protein
MNFDNIALSDLTQDVQIPNTVDEQVEETWFVKYGEEIIGVGLFLPDSKSCILALVGDDAEQKKIIGSYSSSDEHEGLILKGLEIAYEGYLRSIKGDTVIGKLDISE